MKSEFAAIAAATAVLLTAAFPSAGQGAGEMPFANMHDPAKIPFKVEPGFVKKGETCKSQGVVEKAPVQVSNPRGPDIGKYYCASGLPGRVRVDIFIGNAAKPMTTAYIDCPQPAGSHGPSLPNNVVAVFCKKK